MNCFGNVSFLLALMLKRGAPSIDKIAACRLHCARTDPRFLGYRVETPPVAKTTSQHQVEVAKQINFNFIIKQSRTEVNQR